MEPLFLKRRQGKDFFIAKILPFLCQHQFIVHVIQAMDDGDTDPDEFMEGVIDSQNVGVEVIAIRGGYPGYIAVIHRVGEPVLRVL